VPYNMGFSLMLNFSIGFFIGYYLKVFAGRRRGYVGDINYRNVKIDIWTRLSDRWRFRYSKLGRPKWEQKLIDILIRLHI
jgi:hypothetical protein